MQNKGNGWWLVGVRLALAALGIAAITAQLLNTSEITGGDFNRVNFFSFFTIQSNILAILVFLAGAYLALRQQKSAAFDYARGGVVVYMALTGVVYALLLRGVATQIPTFVEWSDTALHVVLPAAILLDWLVMSPARVISFKAALGYLVFPALWFVYTLVRATQTGWYPYPFLDPNTAGGSLGVTLYCLAVAVLVLAFAWLIAKTSQPTRN